MVPAPGVSKGFKGRFRHGYHGDAVLNIRAQACHRFGFSYNWAMIGAILYNAGHKIILHDYSCEDFDNDAFVSQLINEKTRSVIIEFDSFALKRSENDRHGQFLADSIRNNCPEIAIIAYGYYCCITGRDVPRADITIKQNNINLVLSALHQLDKTVPLIHYDSFDSFPFINRSLIHSIPYFRKNRNSTLVQTARGCENSCIFCQRKGWQSKYLSHDTEYVLSEFETLKSQDFRTIWVIDENFTFRLDRAKDILKRLIEHNITTNMKIAISSWANIDTEFLDIASQANIKIISFGIESGNAGILKFYRKNIDLQTAKQVIQYANSIGIFTIGNFIIGAPMETVETINETFSFIKECSFDQINIKTLDYMIGSELYSSASASITKGSTHIFACKELGLNNFTLEEFRNIKKSFLHTYYNNRKQDIRKKIDNYGTPFDI
jgi:uncharacterized radical SAM superfamily protein